MPEYTKAEEGLRKYSAVGQVCGTGAYPLLYKQTLKPLTTPDDGGVTGAHQCGGTCNILTSLWSPCRGPSGGGVLPGSAGGGCMLGVHGGCEVGQDCMVLPCR